MWIATNGQLASGANSPSGLVSGVTAFDSPRRSVPTLLVAVTVNV